MSRCSPFPPAGYRVRRERYEELIDIIKVLKEKLRKEKTKKKRGKEMREKRNEMKKKGKEMREKRNEICDIVKRDLELEPEEEEDEEYFSNERRRKRRRDDETETETLNQFQFEGSSSSLSSITEEEEGDDSLPVLTSSYDSTGNNNKMAATTTRRKWNIRGVQEEEYKHDLQQLQKLFPPRLLDAAVTLPPFNLDWLYPDTTKTSKEDDDTRRAETRQRPSESISCSSWSRGPRAQYLHEVHTFALPFVVPF